MGSLNGVGISKGAVGANSTAPSTSPSCLISNAPAIEGKVALDTVYEIKSVPDAELLGITAAYDVTNLVVLHRHIVDFYSMASEGTSLRLMLTSQFVPSVALEDVNAMYAKKLITSGAGDTRNFGLAWNFFTVDNGTEAIVDGMSSQIRACIAKAQLLADWAFQHNKAVHILLECRRLSDTLSTALNLRNILVNDVLLECPDVSLVAGQDWNYAESRKNAAPNVQYYAAVGKALGTLAAAEMNQSIGEVAVFNLSDAKRGYFTTIGLSNHKKNADVEASLQTLDDKGYIFPISYNTKAVSGYRWNNDHVCLPIVIDAEGNINPHMIYFGRTLNEVSRSLRDKLLQSLKKRLKADGATGKLTTGVIKTLEGEGNEVFDTFERYGFISEGITIVDANSDLITPPKSLLVDFEIVPTSILDNLQGTVRLKKQLSV